MSEVRRSPTTLVPNSVPEFVVAADLSGRRRIVDAFAIFDLLFFVCGRFGLGEHDFAGQSGRTFERCRGREIKCSLEIGMTIFFSSAASISLARRRVSPLARSSCASTVSANGGDHKTGNGYRNTTHLDTPCLGESFRTERKSSDFGRCDRMVGT